MYMPAPQARSDGSVLSVPIPYGRHGSLPPVSPSTAHSALMDHLHGLMGHPNISAAHKADYAKAQGLMAALQAKMHAEPQQPTSAAPGQMGGVQNPEDAGYPVGQMQAMPDLTSLLTGHTFQAPQNPLLTALLGHGYGG